MDAFVKSYQEHLNLPIAPLDDEAREAVQNYIDLFKSRLIPSTRKMLDSLETTKDVSGWFSPWGARPDGLAGLAVADIAYTGMVMPADRILELHGTLTKNCPPFFPAPMRFTPGSIRDVPSKLRAQYRANETLRYYREDGGKIHVIHNPDYRCAYVVDERLSNFVKYYPIRLQGGKWVPGTVRYNLPREPAMYFASGVLSLQ